MVQTTPLPLASEGVSGPTPTPPSRSSMPPPRVGSLPEICRHCRAIHPGAGVCLCVSLSVCMLVSGQRYSLKTHLQLAFFCIFLHFQFWPEVAFFFAFFLHHDVTSARKNASQRVGSCIFKVFLCRRRIRRRLFFLMQL